MPSDKIDRSKAIEMALIQIEKQFGKGSIMRLGSTSPISDVSVVPTGSLELDSALGVGGFPQGTCGRGLRSRCFRQDYPLPPRCC